jgi:hypothetical protein
MMPSFLQRMDQTWEVNCVPLSDVITAGTPNLATQVVMRVFAQVAAAIFRTDVASSHLVDLSIMVMM